MTRGVAAEFLPRIAVIYTAKDLVRGELAGMVDGLRVEAPSQAAALSAARNL